MKTAMQEAIDKVSFIINMLHDTPDEMYMPHVMDLLKANLNELLDTEKEQIIEAHGLQFSDIQDVVITGEEYYNQKYQMPELKNTKEEEKAYLFNLLRDIVNK